MDRLLIVGLDRPESSEIVARTGLPAVVTVALPRVKLVRGVLHVERPGAAGAFLPVNRVIFHGIYADDLNVLTHDEATASGRGTPVGSAVPS